MTGAVLLAVGCALVTFALVAYVRHRYRPDPPADDQPSAKPIRGELWLWEAELRSKAKPKRGGLTRYDSSKRPRDGGNRPGS